MTRLNVHSRIERCYQRMLAAKCLKWRQAWGQGFVTCVSARNAMRSVDEVRDMEKRMGLA
jgi:hypothetical protein